MKQYLEKKWRFLFIMFLAVFQVSAVCAQQSVALSDNDTGLSCKEYTIPVKITGEGFLSLFRYDVVGDLCWKGELEGKTLQVLLSGGGYGPVYWDFPYEVETYSYVRAAAKRGYAVFNLSRIGIGESDRPFGLFVDIDVNAYVVHQVIEHLTGSAGTGSTMTVGHSMGSLMAVAHAVNFPMDVNGVILTGFIHNVNPGYSTAVREGSYFAFFDPRFLGKIWDFTYMTSKPGTRKDMFYVQEQADISVINIDEENKETLTLAEIMTTGDYYDNSTLKIQVPVQIVIGDKDMVGCGGELDCLDSQAVVANEEPYFSSEACIETNVIENTGHNLNLHLNAPASYHLMLDWADRRIGPDTDTAPTEPCNHGS